MVFKRKAGDYSIPGLKSKHRIPSSMLNHDLLSRLWQWAWLGPGLLLLFSLYAFVQSNAFLGILGLLLAALFMAGIWFLPEGKMSLSTALIWLALAGIYLWINAQTLPSSRPGFGLHYIPSMFLFMVLALGTAYWLISSFPALKSFASLIIISVALVLFTAYQATLLPSFYSLVFLFLFLAGAMLWLALYLPTGHLFPFHALANKLKKLVWPKHAMAKLVSPEIFWAYLIFFLLLAFLSLLIIKSAWVVDDAYISFRTIENFLQGRGLTWNPVERVQAFTHPLWLFSLAGLKFITHEIYLTSMGWGWFCTLSAVILVMTRIAATRYTAMAALLMLSFSKAFIDYATSGMENSLTYLLMAIFFIYYFQNQRNAMGLFKLSCLASLSALNRWDVILFYIFPLLQVASQVYKTQGLRRSLLALIAGFTPLVLWEIFSLIYYGFPFPNTAYAKLGTGIPVRELMVQSFYYFLYSCRVDPITPFLLAISSFLPYWLKRRSLFPAVLGMLTYLIYIVSIGGDSMGGRYLAAPVFAAVLFLAQSLPLGPRSAIGTVGLLLLLGCISPYNPWKSDAFYQKGMVAMDNLYGVDDARAGYYQSTGWLRPTPQKHFGIDLGKKLKSSAVKVFVHSIIGYLGYYAGPEVHIIDVWGLSDPLLARLPCAPQVWRIGHFTRHLPSGYHASIASGQNQIQDKDLAAFYQIIKLITQGPLFTWQRWQAILKMNLGGYNVLLKPVQYQQQALSRQERMLASPYGFFIRAPGNDLYVKWVNYGVYAAWEDHIKTARNYWRRALQLDAQRPEAHANLGVLYDRLGQDQLALAAYTIAAEQLGHPWDQYALELKSSAGLSPGKEKQNLAAAPSWLLSESLAWIRVQDESLYAAWIQQGIQAVEKEQWPQAYVYWQKALTLDPDQPAAHANLARWYEQNGLMQLALKHYAIAAKYLGDPWTQYFQQLQQDLKEK